MNIGHIAKLFSLSSSIDKELTGFCIDSRILEEGNLFIAIVGDRLDGHDYIREAEKKGAAAILCQKALPDVAIPQLVVEDTLVALAKLARFHRESLRLPVVALTGSNGKTTVKEMIASILPKPSYATKGNLNNHIGAPLSVLQLKPEHRYAVFELGANHPGEIAFTTAIVQPQVALINNIGPAHIEGFGSIEGVAKTKGEIFEGLAAGGTAVINADDKFAHFWDDIVADKKVLRFSQTQAVDFYTENLSFNAQGAAEFTLIWPEGRDKVSLQVPGKHQVSNALASAACAFALGISGSDIIRHLSQFKGVAGRMTYLSGKNKATVIDDTYNANLSSVLTALQVLAECKGKRIFVFGDMGELGGSTLEHHQEVGEAAKDLGIDIFLTWGKHSEAASQKFGKTAKHYADKASLTSFLLTQLDEDTTILVKGSRSSAMENIVEGLLG